MNFSDFFEALGVAAFGTKPKKTESYTPILPAKRSRRG